MRESKTLSVPRLKFSAERGAETDKKQSVHAIVHLLYLQIFQRVPFAPPRDLLSLFPESVLEKGMGGA